VQPHVTIPLPKDVVYTKRIEKISKYRLSDDTEGEGCHGRVGLARVITDFNIESPLHRGTFGEHGDELGDAEDGGCVPGTAAPAGDAGAVARRDAGKRVVGRHVVAGRRIARGGWLSRGREGGAEARNTRTLGASGLTTFIENLIVNIMNPDASFGLCRPST
jgi:hypothetical protein